MRCFEDGNIVTKGIDETLLSTCVPEKASNPKAFGIWSSLHAAHIWLCPDGNPKHSIGYRLSMVHEMHAVTHLSLEHECPLAISGHTLALQLLESSMYMPLHDHINR